MDERTRKLLARGREHYDRREFDKADAILREITLQEDRFADVSHMLGVIAHWRGDLKAAARYFESAVERNPSYTEALLNLAVTYNDLGKYDDARQVNSRIRRLESSGPISIDPFTRGKIANMHADLGRAYAEAGILTEAIEEYAKAIALCPGFADIRTRLGNLYRDSGDFERARGEYQAAKDANPKYALARIMLGVTLFSLGDTVGALTEWRDVLALEPDNRSAQMYVRMIEAKAMRQQGGLQERGAC